MLLIVPDDGSTSPSHAVSMAKGCIKADSALTGGLYSKVMDEAFMTRDCGRRGRWTIHRYSPATWPSTVPQRARPVLGPRRQHPWAATTTSAQATIPSSATSRPITAVT